MEALLKRTLSALHSSHPLLSTIVQFHLDPEQGKLTAGLPIPRGSMLHSQPVDGYPCKFKTCFDSTLWPLKMAAAQWVTPDRLRPAVKSQDAVAALRSPVDCFPDVFSISWN